MPNQQVGQMTPVRLLPLFLLSVLAAPVSCSRGWALSRRPQFRRPGHSAFRSRGTARRRSTRRSATPAVRRGRSNGRLDRRPCWIAAGLEALHADAARVGDLAGKATAILAFADRGGPWLSWPRWQDGSRWAATYSRDPSAVQARSGRCWRCMPASTVASAVMLTMRRTVTPRSRM
jgi:hypothetical protein